MATIAIPATAVFVIEGATGVITDPRTGEVLEFASATAARLAMRDLALSPRHYRITEA